MPASPFLAILGLNDHQGLALQVASPDDPLVPLPADFLKTLRLILARRWARQTFTALIDDESHLSLDLATLLSPEGVLPLLLFDAMAHGLLEAEPQPFQGVLRQARWFLLDSGLPGLATTGDLPVLVPETWADDLQRYLDTTIKPGKDGAYALDPLYERWHAILQCLDDPALFNNGVIQKNPQLAWRDDGLFEDGQLVPQGPCLQVVPPGCLSEPRGFKKVAQALLKPLPFALWPDRTAIWSELQAEFPWASEVIETVALRARFSQRVGQGVIRMPPLLLVGPAGCGKTRLAERLGELLGMPHFTISAAGADPSIVRGTEQHWASGIPSPVLRFIAEQRCPNPLIIVDEVDKQNQRYDHGTLQNALLALLESSSATHIHDPYFEVPCDLSEVFWILTANDLSDVTGPLRSRVEILPMRHPRWDDLPVIAQKTRQSVARRYRCGLSELPWTEADDAWVRRQLAQRFSVRDARRLIEKRLMGWPHLDLTVVTTDPLIEPAPVVRSTPAWGSLISLTDRRPKPEAESVSSNGSTPPHPDGSIEA